MRAIEKGAAPKIYTRHQDAQPDLIRIIGGYCSYCEMPILNMPAVEHVIALINGGAELDWENFLLACWYCNGSANKWHRNPSRLGYLWPDIDNTHLAFVHTQLIPIVTVNPNLNNSQIINAARATIDLVGIDKYPSAGLGKEPTEKDLRWMYRLEAWQMAEQSLRNWQKRPILEMAHQIGLTAKASGFYSVWKTVFQAEPTVLSEIEPHFRGTYNLVDAAGLPIIRANGLI